MTLGIANEAREETYKANDDIISKERFVATLDARTSIECAALDGHEYPLGQAPRPPLHPNCRSTIVPVVDGLEDFVVDRPSVGGHNFRQMAKDEYFQHWKEKGLTEQEIRNRWNNLSPSTINGLMNDQRKQFGDAAFGSVSGKTTYEEWLRRQPESFQNEVLGKTRAEAFRNGAKLEQFVDHNANKPLTLEQLREKEPEIFKECENDGKANNNLIFDMPIADKYRKADSNEAEYKIERLHRENNSQLENSEKLALQLIDRQKTGVNEPQTAAVIKKAIKDKAEEYLFIHDSNGNLLYGNTLYLPNQVGALGEGMKLRTGNIVTHNHPQGTPPSNDDILCAYRYGSKETRIIAGCRVYRVFPQGKLTKEIERSLQNWENSIKYSQEYMKLQNKYEKYIEIAESLGYERAHNAYIKLKLHIANRLFATIMKQIGCKFVVER